MIGLNLGARIHSLEYLEKELWRISEQVCVTYMNMINDQVGGPYMNMINDQVGNRTSGWPLYKQDQ